MTRVVVFVGTRPEAIKMAPVVMELRSRPQCEVSLCASGQHKEMLEDALRDFSLRPDSNLAVMTAGQSLAGLTSRLFQAIDAELERQNPDWVLVQGDTTTVMVAALCAFYRKIRIGHVEAGLRTDNKFSPFPEEMNRSIAGVAADLHFCPTPGARENLLREAVPESRIFVTGNTVVDALHWMRARLDGVEEALPDELGQKIRRYPRMVLITSHRRENFGAGLANICRALLELSRCHADTLFVWPVHLNPQVREPVLGMLGGQDRIVLLTPQSYRPFLFLMQQATVILTDSGGMQEEATVLGKAALVMRDTTERPEGINAGAAKLVGTSDTAIIREVTALLESPQLRKDMADRGEGLYGDGRAAARIADAVLDHETEPCVG
ncbi:UDP-N-acetylglucosamine 2-epimerase (non-hydrolyzing) [Desulfovibrio sp. OttesenSCG-928-A18]|nr:UDP-N-acetylglucosamine 2-epimerase (non-hydrolyzing) [Desulfovibrio sp. OttesenSCG-928-A18]